MLSAQHASVARQLWADGETGLGAAIDPLFSGGDLSALGETADGRWVLACDARLDDRRALAARLGQDARPGSGALLLAAWQRWGVEAPEHLCGDYAVMAWDRAEQALVLARDRFGQRPL